MQHFLVRQTRSVYFLGMKICISHRLCAACCTSSAMVLIKFKNQSSRYKKTVQKCFPHPLP